MEERRGVYWGLVGEPEGKKLLGRPIHRWDDNSNNRKWDMGTWTGSGWLKVGTDGGLL
jgi:hypothetical protein